MFTRLPHPFPLLPLMLALLLPVGCAVQPTGIVTSQSIEVAFSPEAGAETLVVKVLASAQQTVRLAGYSFTSPAVVKGLLDAKRRGVDVRVLLDDKGNRGAASLLAIKMITEANISLRVISTYAIHHDKYIVVDSRHTETGSFNYSQAAARAISENVPGALEQRGRCPALFRSLGKPMEARD